MRNIIKPMAAILMMMALSVDSLAAYWIDEMNKKPGAYVLTKNDGSKVPVAVFKSLEKGDCIDVTGAGAILWIASDSAKREMLSHDGASHKCLGDKDFGRAPTWSSNLAKWIGERVTSPRAGRTNVIAAASRGIKSTGINIPLARQEGLRMAVGKRPLHLAWQGGKPPFRVDVVSQDDQKTVFQQDGIAENRISIDPVPLAEGVYRIEIGDAAGTIPQTLHMVSPKAIPSPPSGQGGGKGPKEDAMALLEAAWLASQGNGWALEAYQTVKELALKGYQPAQILQESLEQGEFPDPPPTE